MKKVSNFYKHIKKFIQKLNSKLDLLIHNSILDNRLDFYTGIFQFSTSETFSIAFQITMTNEASERLLS